MTHKELFSDARWLCPKSDADAALFRAEFINDKAQSAEITICGLGYFICMLTGRGLAMMNLHLLPLFLQPRAIQPRQRKRI